MSELDPSGHLLVIERRFLHRLLNLDDEQLGLHLADLLSEQSQPISGGVGRRGAGGAGHARQVAVAEGVEGVCEGKGALGRCAIGSRADSGQRTV